MEAVINEYISRELVQISDELIEKTLTALRATGELEAAKAALA